MSGYLFSIQPIWFFCVAAFLAIMLKKRHPYACYALWLIVLIKFFFPAGIHDLYYYSRVDLSQGYNAVVANFTKPVTPKSFLEERFESTPRKISIPPILKPVDIIHNQSIIWEFVFSKLFLNYFLIGAWCASSLYMLIKLTTYLVKIRIAKRYWKVIDSGPIYDLYVECCSIAKLDFVPELLINSNNKMPPAAYGTKEQNAYVSIPQRYFEKPGDPALASNEMTLKTVFCHELSHIRNKDSIVDFFRSICKIFFPIHPLRILADKFFIEQREICRDLDAAKMLGIDGLQYAHSLARLFLINDDHIYGLSPLSSSFLLGDKPCLKRILFLKQNSQSLNLQKKRSLLFILPVVFLFFFNISPLANILYQDLSISEKHTTLKFPNPKYFYALKHGVASYPKIHNDTLWICDELTGLFSYRFSEEYEPMPIASYKISPKIEVTHDVSFYGDYAYLAVGNADYMSFERSRVDILNISNNNIAKLGEFPENHPRQVLVVDDYLWVIGSGFLESEGAIALYSLETPDDPQMLDFFYIMNLPNTIHHNEFTDQILVSTQNQIIVFKNHVSLEIEQEINFDINPVYMEFIDKDHFIATAYFHKSGGFNEEIEHFLIYCSMDWNRQYQIDNCTRIITQDNQKDLLFYCFENKFVVVIPGIGLATLKYTDKMFQLESFMKNNCWYGVTYRDKLIFIYPEIQVFNGGDFGASDNEINVWIRL